MTTSAEQDAAALMASPVRRSLVAALEAAGRPAEGAPGMTAAELAPHVGLHVTTVRFHLDQLVAAGVLTARFVRQDGAGRPRKVYVVADRVTHDAEGPLRLLATLLAEAMTAGVSGERLTPVEAGRRWVRDHLPGRPHREPAETPGAWIARVGEVIDVLDEWGYQPELSTSDGGRNARVELSDCPFLDLARENEAVVCGVHRGLIAESMRRVGEPGAEVSLEPFVAPDRCLAHIRRTTPFHSTAAPPPEERT